MSEPLPEFVEIGDSVLFQALQDEIVLLNMTSQEYYGLDSIGSDIWQQLLEQRNVGVVRENLTAVYAADEDLIRSDFDTLIRDLLAAGLLRTAKL